MLFEDKNKFIVNYKNIIRKLDKSVTLLYTQNEELLDFASKNKNWIVADGFIRPFQADFELVNNIHYIKFWIWILLRSTFLKYTNY